LLFGDLILRPNTVDSMNSIKPSNICALLAKCRSAASIRQFTRERGSGDFLALGCSSMDASVLENLEFAFARFSGCHGFKVI